MNILAFDTCLDACSAAAGRGLRSLTPDISFLAERMHTGQAERLMPMIDEVMRDVRLAFSDLDIIAVTTGPGTFTGTRIAVSAARALALATGARIASVTSLRLMAMSPEIISGASRKIAIATDARRGEVYVEVFDRHSMRTLLSPAAISLADVPRVIGTEPIMVAGSGAAAFCETLRRHGGQADAIAPDLLPDAFDMLFQAFEMPLTSSVSPLYLRPPDAKPPSANPYFGAGA